MKPQISVIIPTYNEESNIEHCLKTLCAQSINNFEIIIVDDGSTDKTKDIVKKYNVRLIEQNHDGPGKARNLGVKHSVGDILVFVDADMFFDKYFIEYLTKPILNGETIGTFTKDEFIGNPDNKWAVCWNLEHMQSWNRRLGDNHPEESIVFRAILKEKFLQAGGYDASLGYEDDISLFRNLGIKARHAPYAISYHNNPANLAEIFKSARWMGRSIRFLEKPRRLLWYSLPISLLMGFKNIFKYNLIHYFVFKIVHDLGIFIGGISRLLFKKYTK